MALNLIKQIAVLGQRSFVRKSLLAKINTRTLYEPDYLETGKSEIPMLPTLNVQIKGYDYPVLESYQTFVHKLADMMQIDIEDSWAYPHQQFKIQRYESGTTVIVSEYNLNLYERNIQLSEVSSVKCSVLIRTLEAALPQGVNLNINIYDPEQEYKRYVPDKELLDLKVELDTLKIVKK